MSWSVPHVHAYGFSPLTTIFTPDTYSLPCLLPAEEVTSPHSLLFLGENHEQVWGVPWLRKIRAAFPDGLAQLQLNWSLLNAENVYQCYILPNEPYLLWAGLSNACWWQSDIFTTAKAHFQVQQGVEIAFLKAKIFPSSYHCFSIDYWELTSVKLLGPLSDTDMWDLLLQKSLARFEPLTCGAERRPTPLKLKAELHQLH